MARKKSALVELNRDRRSWSLRVSSTDEVLLKDIANAIGQARSRGIDILNTVDPLAGIDAKPRKVNAKKPATPAEGKPHETNRD